MSLADAGGLTVAVEALADADWLAMALSGLPPVRAGRFFVYGVHDRGRAPVNAVKLRIEAGAAFGTGHHGTTVGCLLAYDALLKRARFARVLDVGCGTGVLGIAAARTGTRTVLGTDIDPISVRIARENAAVNRVRARFVHASGLADARVQAGGALRPRLRQHPGPPAGDAGAGHPRRAAARRPRRPVGPSANAGAHGEGRLPLARLPRGAPPAPRRLGDAGAAQGLTNAQAIRGWPLEALTPPSTGRFTPLTKRGVVAGEEGDHGGDLVRLGARPSGMRSAKLAPSARGWRPARRSSRCG